MTWIAGAVIGARGARGRRHPSDNGSCLRLGAVVAAIAVMRVAGDDLRPPGDQSSWIEIPRLVLVVASTVFTIWARVRLGRM